MTLSALQQTQVGATVSKLRKSETPEIAGLASTLIKDWKRIAELSGREMEGDGCVSRSGKSCAEVHPDERVAKAAERMVQRYAQLEQQKRSRQLQTIEPSEVPRPGQKRPRR